MSRFDAILTHGYSLAPRWKRLVAFIFDSIVAIIVSSILSALLVDSSEKTEAGRLIKLLVLLVYFGGSTAIWAATPGKMWLNMKIVSQDLKPLPLWKLIIRETLGRFLGYSVLGHFWLLFNSRNKTAGDFLVGSLVVHPPKKDIQSVNGG